MPSNATLSFDEEDELGIDKLAIILGVRYPDVTWCELVTDGVLGALVSQGSEGRGGAVAVYVQRVASDLPGERWRVVCDGVQVVADATSAGRAALEAAAEVGFQWLTGAS